MKPFGHAIGRAGSVRAVGCAAAVGLLLAITPAPAGAAPTPSVTINDVTVTEGSSGTSTASFTVRAAPRPRGCCALAVSWSTADGTAASPADYAGASGTVTLTQGSPSKTISVAVVGDGMDEPDETFVVNLTNLAGTPGAIGDDQGVATITDDDGPPSVSIGDVSVTEGNAGTTAGALTLSLSGASGFPVSVDWSTVGGSADPGADFVTATGTGTIAAGATSTAIPVAILGDATDENAETFTVSLSSPVNATIGSGTGTVTIIDDDPFPVLSIDDPSVTEGNAGSSTMTFAVTLTPASGRSVKVDWTTADGGATQPGDYLAGSGTLTFAPGDTGESVDVTIIGDLAPELDEDLSVVLSNPVRGSIGDGVGTGTILDDELASVIDIGEPVVPEGDAGTTTMAVPVTLSNPSALPVTVDWTTSAGSAAGGADYLDASGTVTFAPFDVSETIEVTVYGDTTYEAAETLAIDLSDAANATIGDPQGLATISNDDPVPALSIGNVTADEGDVGDTVFTFPVSLDRGSEVDLAVDYAATSVSATAGSDYVATSGTLVIPAGTPSGSIDVPVKGDSLYEAAERFDVVLSAPSSATIADGSGRGTISNDDPAPALSIGDATVTEGSGTSKTIAFTVTLSEPSGVAATVDWETSDGTARSPGDYTSRAGTLTFSPGTTSRSISVSVKGDRLDEPRESFTVVLSDPVGATIADGVGVGLIRDDDKTPTTISLQVWKGNQKVKAKGLLEPAKTGFRVSVTLLRKTTKGFTKLSTASVPARYIRDRDHDGLKEGIYLAAFPRPRSAGTYRLVARFAGTSTHRSCTRTVDFTLAAT